MTTFPNFNKTLFLEGLSLLNAWKSNKHTNYGYDHLRILFDWLEENSFNFIWGTIKTSEVPSLYHCEGVGLVFGDKEIIAPNSKKSGIWSENKETGTYYKYSIISAVDINISKDEGERHHHEHLFDSIEDMVPVSTSQNVSNSLMWTEIKAVGIKRAS